MLTIALALLAGLALGASAAVAAAHTTTAAVAAPGLRLVGRTMLDPRLEQLEFRTPAVAGITGVRVLLPAGYDRNRRRRYPVLYLLHGALDDETAWTAKGDAEQLTRRYPIIVVMPDSGEGGGYTNWFNGGRGGPPQWETYHIDQLIPWIDTHLRTRATRAERAIAGVSMGGFGAFSYAARHPDLFGQAASFSGALDTNNPLDIAITPSGVFGPRATEQLVWRAHNPYDLAANLRGVRLIMWTGTGQPGGPFGGGDIVEQTVFEMNTALHQRLTALRIPSAYHDYGPGGHDWPYWRRDLRETLPTLMEGFDADHPAPATFTYKTSAARYTVYGWSVTMHRRASEFSTLSVTRNGFSLTGSGSATVTTPGRVTTSVSLGPSNAYQQYTTPPHHAPWRSVTVRVRLGARS